MSNALTDNADVSYRGSDKERSGGLEIPFDVYVNNVSKGFSELKR
jgi:hypothetical protein